MATFVEEGLSEAMRGLEVLANLDEKRVRMRVAQRSQSIVEERIEHGKRDLNTIRWAPWSKGYAATRGPEHSLLVDTRRLLNSMNISEGGTVTQMGTSVEYAAKNDIEREFMGLNKTTDRSSVEDAIRDWLNEHF